MSALTITTRDLAFLLARRCSVLIDKTEMSDRVRERMAQDIERFAALLAESLRNNKTAVNLNKEESKKC